MIKTQGAQPFIWAGLAVLSLLLYLASGSLSQLNVFPKEWMLSPTQAMNDGMNAFVGAVGPAFKSVGSLLEWPVKGSQALLQFLPWSVTTAIFIMLGYIGSGWRLALFAGLSMLYMAVIGYWDESMNSLAIVLISVPMAVTTGFVLGVWGFYSDRAKRIQSHGGIGPASDQMFSFLAFASSSNA